MKTQRAVLPLAFLSAAFMLACQDQGSSPVEPEGPGILLAPGGDHPHGGGANGDAATFTATITLDGTSVGDIDLIEGGGGGMQTDPGTPGVPGTPAMLDLSFFQAAVIDGYTAAEGGNCFGAGVFTGPLQIFVKKNDLPNASILFSFTAKGDDGTTDVNYALRLFGVITTPNDWPPPGDNTITGGTFNMQHENGPGRNVACTGNGNLNFSIEVVRDPS